jgi:hypothetical protein
MKAWWAKHGSFVLPVAIGAALMAGWYFGFYRGLRDEAAAFRLEAEALAQEAGRVVGGVANEKDLAAAANDLQQRAEALDTLTRQVHFALPEWARAALEKGAGPVKFSTEVTQQADAFARKGLRLKGGGAVAMGFAVEKPPESLAPEYLLRLAVVIRLLEVMIDAGARNVQKVVPFPNPSRPAPEDAEVPARFLNGVAVRVSFEDTAARVFEVVHRIQSPPSGKPYLSILAFEARQPNPGADLLKAELVVGALSIERDAPVAPPAAEEP